MFLCCWNLDVTEGSICMYSLKISEIELESLGFYALGCYRRFNFCMDSRRKSEIELESFCFYAAGC